jgi:hypothetical protein
LLGEGLLRSRSLSGAAEGADVAFLYRVDDATAYEASAAALTAAVDSNELVTELLDAAPGVYVTGAQVAVAPASLNVARTQVIAIENAQSGKGGDEGSGSGAVGGIIAGVILVLVVIPAAGLAGVAFLGERDASGHNWLDRLLIRRCPCCARAVLKNPVSASAQAGKRGKRGTKPVIVANPVAALLGADAVNQKPAGAISGKEYLAQRKAARAAEGRVRSRSRSPSSLNVESAASTAAPHTPQQGVHGHGGPANPMMSGGQHSAMHTVVSSSGEVVLSKRIGAPQPHGVLVAKSPDGKHAPISSSLPPVLDAAKGASALAGSGTMGRAYEESKPPHVSPMVQRAMQPHGAVTGPNSHMPEHGQFDHVPGSEDGANYNGSDASRPRIKSFR